MVRVVRRSDAWPEGPEDPRARSFPCSRTEYLAAGGRFLDRIEEGSVAPLRHPLPGGGGPRPVPLARDRARLPRGRAVGALDDVAVPTFTRGEAFRERPRGAVDLERRAAVSGLFRVRARGEPGAGPGGSRGWHRALSLGAGSGHRGGRSRGLGRSRADPPPALGAFLLQGPGARCGPAARGVARPPRHLGAVLRGWPSPAGSGGIAGYRNTATACRAASSALSVSRSSRSAGCSSPPSPAATPYPRVTGGSTAPGTGRPSLRRTPKGSSSPASSARNRHSLPLHRRRPGEPGHRPDRRRNSAARATTSPRSSSASRSRLGSDLRACAPAGDGGNSGALSPRFLRTTLRQRAGVLQDRRHSPAPDL